MNKEIFSKYLNNNCSDQEFDEFAEWVEKQTQEEERKTWVFSHWRNFEPEAEDKDEKKYNLLLDRIHHRINLQSQKNTGRKAVILKEVGKWFSRAAAILLIPLLATVFYLASNHTMPFEKLADLAVDSLEIIAPVGSQTVVQLSDGTEVNLNYASRIKYPRNFNGNTREITLIGEAYFDVAHNPDKPFIVKTGAINVKAVGTEFNVRAYPADNDISTTLVEGKVIIEKVFPDHKTSPINTMMPGQNVTYNLNSENAVSTEVNINKYIAWKDGKMVFDNTPITEVAKELSRKFNVDIEIADEISELTYTVTFVNDPLFLILDLMTETTPISYKRFPRAKLSDGTFSKLKIKIEKRET